MKDAQAHMNEALKAVFTLTKKERKLILEIAAAGQPGSRPDVFFKKNPLSFRYHELMWFKAGRGRRSHGPDPEPEPGTDDYLRSLPNDMLEKVFVTGSSMKYNLPPDLEKKAEQHGSDLLCLTIQLVGADKGVESFNAKDDEMIEYMGRLGQLAAIEAARRVGKFDVHEPYTLTRIVGPDYPKRTTNF